MSKFKTSEHLEWVAKEILAITDELLRYSIDKQSGDQLVNMQTRLAALNVYLGRYAAEAVASTNFAYAYKKWRYADKWFPMKDKLNKIRGKVTDTDTKSAIEKEMDNEIMTHLENQQLADKLMSTWESTQQLINSLAAAIRVKQGERQNAGRQT